MIRKNAISKDTVDNAAIDTLENVDWIRRCQIASASILRRLLPSMEVSTSAHSTQRLAILACLLADVRC